MRSVVFIPQLLTVLPQTELLMNTHVTVSDMRHDVSGIRRDMSKIQEDIGNQVRLVCI